MGCCGVTQRHTGIDEVGPDEIELLELSVDNLGPWNLGESRLQLSVKSRKDEPPYLEQEVVLWGRSKDELHHRFYSQQPIRDWEGQPAHTYGEIVYSSLVSLYNTHTQERREHFLVLFSFHLLILSVDHYQQDFIYEGILPLSGLTFQVVQVASDTSDSSDGFEISGKMVDSKVFICHSAAELRNWMEHLEDRRCESMVQSPTQCSLSYLLPCDEHWKREKLKKYLLQTPIWQWEGPPIQHLGETVFLSLVHIINTKRQANNANWDTGVTLPIQGLQERLMVLFPRDVVLLSVDSQRLIIRYEGRLARQSITAVERLAITGRLEFELKAELQEPLQVSCTCPEDYHTWMFHLQPEQALQDPVCHGGPPLLPKTPRSKKESPDVVMKADQRHTRWT